MSADPSGCYHCGVVGCKRGTGPMFGPESIQTGTIDCNERGAVDWQAVALAAVDEARKAGERIAALEEVLARCAYMIASVTVAMPAWDAKPLYEKVRAILGWDKS